MSHFLLFKDKNKEWQLQQTGSEAVADKLRNHLELKDEHYTFSMEELVQLIKNENVSCVLVLGERQNKYLDTEVNKLLRETADKEDALNYLDDIVTDYFEAMGNSPSDSEREALKQHVAKLIKS